MPGSGQSVVSKDNISYYENVIANSRPMSGLFAF